MVPVSVRDLLGKQTLVVKVMTTSVCLPWLRVYTRRDSPTLIGVREFSEIVGHLRLWVKVMCSDVCDVLRPLLCTK